MATKKKASPAKKSAGGKARAAAPKPRRGGAVMKPVDLAITKPPGATAPAAPRGLRSRSTGARRRA